MYIRYDTLQADYEQYTDRHEVYTLCDSSTSNPDRSARFCSGVGMGRWGKQVGSMNEELQVRGCYNITFICTPTNQETV